MHGPFSFDLYCSISCIDLFNLTFTEEHRPTFICPLLRCIDLFHLTLIALRRPAFIWPWMRCAICFHLTLNAVRRPALIWPWMRCADLLSFDLECGAPRCGGVSGRRLIYSTWIQNLELSSAEAFLSGFSEQKRDLFRTFGELYLNACSLCTHESSINKRVFAI